MTVWITPLAFLIAVAIDLVFGEPPNRFHPVVWMGHFISRLRRLVRTPSNHVRFFSGIGIVVVGGLLVGSVAYSLDVACEQLSTTSVIAALILQAVFLKCCFAIDSLADAARSVQTHLEADALDDARRDVAYHLVSRDTSSLGVDGLSAATIESVAENTCDSFVAPVFYYAIAGLPGAAVYRFVNTCDAMLGYRTIELEWLGKASARLDDALNWLPARLTAFTMIVATAFCRLATRRAIQTWLQDRWKTASPNAGQSMSVAAGALEVCLEKQGHYRIGESFPSPSRDSIGKMLTLFAGTVTLVVIVGSAVFVLRSLIGGPT